MNSGNMEFSTINPQSSSAASRSNMGESASGSYKQQSSSGAAASSDSLLLKDNFGMLGMLDVVRMTNQDLSVLALGTDLTTLGLNLNGGENIYSTFMTPFSDTPTATAAAGTAPASGEPVYTLHSAYTSLRSPVPLSKMKDFSDETMFYIFYAMPRDVLQEAAAQELYSRSWRFHKEFKLWLTKDPANPEPIQKGVDFERGIYVFFDPATWTRVKLERVLYFDHLEERFSLSSNPSASKMLKGIVSDMQKVDIGAK
jgi:CCR4-NOT transcription complex subunit 2